MDSVIFINPYTNKPFRKISLDSRLKKLRRQLKHNGRGSNKAKKNTLSSDGVSPVSTTWRTRKRRLTDDSETPSKLIKWDPKSENSGENTSTIRPLDFSYLCYSGPLDNESNYQNWTLQMDDLPEETYQFVLTKNLIKLAGIRSVKVCLSLASYTAYVRFWTKDTLELALATLKLRNLSVRIAPSPGDQHRVIVNQAGRTKNAFDEYAFLIDPGSGFNTANFPPDATPCLLITFLTDEIEDWRLVIADDLVNIIADYGNNNDIVHHAIDWSSKKARVAVRCNTAVAAVNLACYLAYYSFYCEFLSSDSYVAAFPNSVKNWRRLVTSEPYKFLITGEMDTVTYNAYRRACITELSNEGIDVERGDWSLIRASSGQPLCPDDEIASRLTVQSISQHIEYLILQGSQIQKTGATSSAPDAVAAASFDHRSPAHDSGISEDAGDSVTTKTLATDASPFPASDHDEA